MDRIVLNMLDNEVIKRNLSYIEIMKYIDRQRSNGKFIGISNNEILSYLNSKMHINNYNSRVVSYNNSTYISNDGNNGHTNNTFKEMPDSSLSSKSNTGIKDNVTINKDTKSDVKITPSTYEKNSDNRVNVTNIDTSTSSDTMLGNIPKDQVIDKAIRAFSNGTQNDKNGNNIYLPKIIGGYSGVGSDGIWHGEYNPNSSSDYKLPMQVSIVGEPKVTDGGRVQLNLNIGTEIKPGSGKFYDGNCTLSFTPHNQDGMHRLAVVFPGSGGWSNVPVMTEDGLKSGSGAIDEYFFQNSNLDNDCTVLRVNCYNNDGVYKYIPHLLDDLNGSFESDSSYKNRYTLAGASDGTIQMLEAAKSIVDSRNADSSLPRTPLDMILLDTKGNGGNPGKPFVDKINEYSDLKSELISTGSIIYAHEAGGGLTLKPSDAINNLGVLTEDGMIIVGAENDIAKEHANVNSQELQYTSGTIGNVVYGYKNSTDDNNVTLISNGKSEVPNKYYLVLPKSEWDLKKGQTYYDQRKEITEKQLNAFSEYREIKGIQEDGKYLNDLIGYVETENTEKKGYINLSTGSSVNNDDILFSFQDIIDKTNNVVTEINDTTFKNNGFDYQFSDNSTTDFPESLNRGNAFLYGISNTFLDKVNGDTQNIEIILNDFIDLDNKFGERARSMMDSAFQNGAYFVTDSAIIKDAASYEIENPYYDIFDKQIPKEHAGKISASDIACMFNGSTLTGKIGAGLQNEYDDASRMKSRIEDMINMPDNLVKGDVWDAEKERLKIFVEACSLRMEASQILENAYIEALREVNNYISPDEYLDDGELPAKRAELTACKAVPRLRGTGQYVTLDNGEVEEIMEPNEPEWTNAQIRIKELQGPDGHGGEIAKLEGLAGVLNDANVKIHKAIDEVNSKYNSFVKGIPEVSIGNINISA